MAPQSKIRCRQITESDLDPVIELLIRGFPERNRAYWEKGLRRQAERAVPEGIPRFGYMLDCDGRPVGVLLLFGNAVDVDGRMAARCNVSSWYVEPDFRSYAPLLVAIPLKQKDVTFVNVSPARHTWPVVEAQGFTPLCRGQFTAFPFLGRPVRGVSLREVRADDDGIGFASLPEFEMMRTHAGYGCTSLVVSAPDGDHPFIFKSQRRLKGTVPCPQLIYCRNVDDFVRFAGPVGRFFLRRGMPWMLLDADGPVDGLVGFFQNERGRKYYRGPAKPGLCDLSYTEFALFGP